MLLVWRESPGKSKNPKVRCDLGVLPRDRAKEQWNGYRYGVQGAKKLTDVNETFEFSKLSEKIHTWLTTVPGAGSRPRIFSNCCEYPELKNLLDRIVESYNPPHRSRSLPLEGILDCRHWVGEQRLIKSNEEIAIMRASSKINVQAHREVMRAIRPGIMEYQLQAICESVYTQNGATLAYNSICASGENATILHYNFNNSKVKDGDLFLIDAGCEYRFFASDITRTLPANGVYSEKQRVLMDIVSEAQQAAFKLCRPGQTLAKIHQTASETIIDGLIDLKILKGKRKDIWEKSTHKPFYPHGTGHWLGMDVHDACPYLDAAGNPLKLKPGMVFTVEPGVYFLKDEKLVDEEWRGLGVRIEDDILITSRGHENLTADLPRTADEIEKEMKRMRRQAIKA